MAIQSNFPAIKPSLNLDFANTKKLDSRITFTRASTATYYDGVTTAKAEENLFRQSQDFTDVTYWITNSASVSYTANTTVAPDGTTTADTMTASVGTGTRFGSGSATNAITTGLVYTASLFVKAGTDTVVQLLFPTAQFGANAYANFDLSAGTVGSVGASATATISSAGGTWYRCVITATATASSTTSIGIGFAFTGNNSSATRLPSITAAGTETLILWGAQLEQRSSATSYTATTTQSITNYIPALLTAATNAPRFDHNPTTAESLGLLIEEQRTNLLTYSADFANAAWTQNNTSITSNTAVAPDGTLTSDTVVMNDVSNNDFFIFEVYSGWTSGVTYTQTWYVKSAGISWVQVTGSTGTAATNFRNINIVTGALGNGNYASSNVTVTSVGNGWYRISVTETANSTSASGRFLLALLTSDVSLRLSNVDGDGYSGIYIWGAQLEAGAFPTSYIATGAATATRSADAASMTGTNFSSWYNQSEGAFYSEFFYPRAPTSLVFVFVARESAISNNNRHGIQFSTSSSGSMRGLTTVNNVVQADVFTTPLSTTLPNKVAYGYAVNNFGAAGNNILGTTDTSGTMPTTIDELLIGRSGASNQINGTIKRIAYYTLRLTNAQLQALTG